MPPKTITVDGVEYEPIGSRPTGTRAVVVVDRGWVFAGDVTEKDGRILLTRAVWVRKWSGCWFDGVINNPKGDQVQLSPLNNPVDLPVDSEIFRIPVADDWGL